MPTGPLMSQVHSDAPLTNMSVARLQAMENFVAKEVFPIVGVDKKSDSYYIFNKGDQNRIEMRRKVSGKAAPVAGVALSTDTYVCDAHNIRWACPKDIGANQDAGLDLNGVDGVNYITNQIAMKMDELFSSAFFQPAVWTTDWDGVSSGPSTNQILQWDQSGSNPIADIAKLKMTIAGIIGQPMNKLGLLVGPRVDKVLQSHSSITGRLTGAAVTTEELIKSTMAALFGVRKYTVANSIYTTSAKGATDAFGYAFTDNDVLVYYAPENGVSLRTESAGYIMGWKGMPGNSKYGTRIRKYYTEDEDTDYIEGEIYQDMKLTGVDCGGFIDAAVVATA